MPGARCTRSLACEIKSIRVSHHRFTETFRHSLRDGVTVSFEVSPETGFLSPSPPRSVSFFGRLIPASGYQDATTSPSASGALVTRAARVHRIPHPTFVTIAKRPLCPGNLAERANGRLSENRPLLELSP
jgi:hypothetical protein